MSKPEYICRKGECRKGELEERPPGRRHLISFKPRGFVNGANMARRRTRGMYLIGTAPRCGGTVRQRFRERTKATRKERTIVEESSTWSNKDIVLFHGTNQIGTDSIQEHGVSLRYSKPLLDFGRGFYTTTSDVQANDWARKKAFSSGFLPYLLLFRISRDALAALDSIWFVRATAFNADLWSFVEFCRQGGENHGRKSGCYDVVAGPVTLRSRSRMLLAESDQVSFHTERSIKILNEAQIEAIRL